MTTSCKTHHHTLTWNTFPHSGQLDIRREYDDAASEPPGNTSAGGPQHQEQQSSEAGNDRLHQRPFLLSHARIHRVDHHLTALSLADLTDGAAQQRSFSSVDLSGAAGVQAVRDADTTAGGGRMPLGVRRAAQQCAPSQQLCPAGERFGSVAGQPPARVNSKLALQLGLATTRTRVSRTAGISAEANMPEVGAARGPQSSFGSAHDAAGSAAASRAPMDEHGRESGVPPAGPPALVTELRRLARLKRTEGSTAALGVSGLGVRGPSGSASTAAADRQPPSTSCAPGPPAWVDRKAAKHGQSGGGDAGRTLGAELRALRAQPRGRNRPESAQAPGPLVNSPQWCSIAADGKSGVATAAADSSAAPSCSRHASARQSDKSARLEPATSSHRCPEGSGEHVIQTSSSGRGRAAMLEQPHPRAAPDPAPTRVFDGIWAIFDPGLDPAEAARYSNPCICASSGQCWSSPRQLLQMTDRPRKFQGSLDWSPVPLFALCLSVPRLARPPFTARVPCGRARAALLAGGGLEVGGAYLGCNATHVVCRPDSASLWLSMGTFLTVEACPATRLCDQANEVVASGSALLFRVACCCFIRWQPNACGPVSMIAGITKVMHLAVSPISCAGMNIVSAQWVLRSACEGSLQRVVAISVDASRRLPADGSARPRSVTESGDAGSRPDGVDGGELMDRAAREALLAKLTREQVNMHAASVGSTAP